MNSKFFTFIAPFLRSIDSGRLFRKPFSWLYVIIAFVHLLIPVIAFVRMEDSNFFEYYAAAASMILVVITFTCWISFQIWWNRRKSILEVSSDGDDFVATPVFAHFIQTTGESIGTFLAVGGTLSSLVAFIIIGRQGFDYLENFGGDLFEAGAAVILLFPVYGYLTILVTRYFAELIRALASIANNTKKGEVL